MIEPPVGRRSSQTARYAYRMIAAQRRSSRAPRTQQAAASAVRLRAKSDLTMQEYLDGSNKNEPEDAKSPSQNNGIRAGIR